MKGGDGGELHSFSEVTHPCQLSRQHRLDSKRALPVNNTTSYCTSYSPPSSAHGDECDTRKQFDRPIEHDQGRSFSPHTVVASRRSRRGTSQRIIRCRRDDLPAKHTGRPARIAESDRPNDRRDRSRQHSRTPCVPRESAATLSSPKRLSPRNSASQNRELVETRTRTSRPAER